MESINCIVEVWMPIFTVHMFELSVFVLLVWAVDKIGHLRVHLRYGLYLLTLAKAFVPPVVSLPERLSGAIPVPLSFQPIVANLKAVNKTEGCFPSTLFFGLWVGVACVLTGIVIRQNIILRRRLRQAIPISTPPVCFVMRPEIAKLEFFFARAIQIPVLIGFLRPRLYLPKGWDKWPQDHLCSIVAHEMAHFRARDLWAQVFQTLSLILFGLNPLVWLLNRRLNQLRELRCDVAAVRKSGIRPIEYSKLLYAFLERQSSPVLPGVSGAYFSESSSFLVTRFRHVLSLPRAEPDRLWHYTLPVLLALAIFPLSYRYSEPFPNSLHAGQVASISEDLFTFVKAGIDHEPMAKEELPKLGDAVQVDQLPVAVKVPKPVYPEEARLAGIEGDVNAQILVDQAGRVRGTRILHGAKIFQESVKEAAEQSVWRPALWKDRPVAVWVPFPKIQFRLRENGS